MRSHALRALAIGALLVPLASLTVVAQGRGPDGPRGPRAPRDSGEIRVGATQLLNSRRELDLTPRQVAALDSIERVQYARRREFAERMRASQDSLGGGARQRPATPEARDSMRARFEARREAMRPQFEQQRRADSISTAAAMRLLNDTQRQRVREIVIERRAEARGRMQAMRGMGPGGQGRGFGPGRGPGAGPRGFGPGEGARMRRAPGMPGDVAPRQARPRRPAGEDSLTAPAPRR